MASTNVLDTAADIITHVRVSDETKVIVFPATRYPNVISRPTIVNDVTKLFSAPFGFYRTDSDNLTRSQIRSLIGPIL